MTYASISIMKYGKCNQQTGMSETDVRENLKYFPWNHLLRTSYGIKPDQQQVYQNMPKSIHPTAVTKKPTVSMNLDNNLHQEWRGCLDTDGFSHTSYKTGTATTLHKRIQQPFPKIPNTAIGIKRIILSTPACPPGVPIVHFNDEFRLYCTTYTGAVQHPCLPHHIFLCRFDLKVSQD